MASPAFAKYQEGVANALALRCAVTGPRLRPLSRTTAQVFLHAALATLVAAWDAYVNELVRNFFSETASPLDARYEAIHAVARESSERAGLRFNTPNWENAREFLVHCTGYDPFNDWVWPKRSMGAQAVKIRLNEILKVRHSFAHGFVIPAFPWTQSRSGRTRLTVRALADTEAFFNNLVRQTDRGMKAHIASASGRTVGW